MLVSRLNVATESSQILQDSAWNHCPSLSVALLGSRLAGFELAPRITNQKAPVCLKGERQSQRVGERSGFKA